MRAERPIASVPAALKTGEKYLYGAMRKKGRREVCNNDLLV